MLRIQLAGAPSLRDRVAPAVGADQQATVARDFSDPYLEFLRLLEGAAEIEHALLVQYLYAAFSVSPEYPLVAGSTFASPGDLMGVAIQEMQHLHVVNQILVAVGGAPALVSHDFPYEPAIYPFPLHLEALSRASLAKYVYAEAPAAAVDQDNPANAGERAFLDLLFESLGDVRPNHVGSLYASLIGVARELAEVAGLGLPDLGPWVEKLERIKDEGEDAHFKLFKQLFLGTHRGFRGREVWSLAPDDPLYPARAVAADPSAYRGHPKEILDDEARRVAWLGDLEYWIVLMLLDLFYRQPDVPDFMSRAQAHMTGNLFELGLHLPTMGVGLPFDPLAIGYSPGLDRERTVRVLRQLLSEAQRETVALESLLPATYPTTTDEATSAELARLEV